MERPSNDEVRELMKIADLQVLYPPTKITADVIKFCERLHGSPRYVAVKPIAPTPLNECLLHSERAVRERGGAVVMGWMISAWPTMFLEAEFHAAWKSERDELVDVSPKRDNECRILFVPDDRIAWQGQRIPSKFMPLRQSNDVSEYVGAAQRQFDLMGPEIGPGVVTRELAENGLKLMRAKKALLAQTPKDLILKARAAAGCSD